MVVADRAGVFGSSRIIPSQKQHKEMCRVPICALKHLMLVLYVICSHLQHFLVLMEGFDLLESRHEGEEKLLKLSQDKRVFADGFVRSTQLAKLECIARGFSPMKGSHFVSFLVRRFACTAVILQSDNRVVRVMNHRVSMNRRSRGSSSLTV